MSEANKKIRDLERSLRRERENTARAQRERDAALEEVERLRSALRQSWIEGSNAGWKAARG
jgi:hypothetical protein